MATMLLTLAGHMMSFGGATSGAHRTTLAHPTNSALTGLIGNALGYDREADAERLDALVEHLDFTTREDRSASPAGIAIDDQNVHVLKIAGKATSIPAGPLRPNDDTTFTLNKLCSYLVDARFAVAVTSTHPDLSAHTLAEAIVAPKRILYLGRRCCLPGLPLVDDVVDEPPLEALRRRAHGRALYRGRTDLFAGEPGPLRTVQLPTKRRFANGIHAFSYESLAEIELDPLR